VRAVNAAMLRISMMGLAFSINEIRGLTFEKHYRIINVTD
jgi:hypothetical protein